MPRQPVPPLDDLDEEWAALRADDTPRRTWFDDDHHLVHVEQRLQHPWWVYACLVLDDDMVKLVEVRVFPSVERDEFYEAVSELDRSAPRSDPRWTRYRLASERRPAWGKWRRTGANLAAARSGLAGTVLAGVRPALLVSQALAEADYLTRLLGPTPTAADALASAPIRSGRTAKSDLYYARLAEEYSRLVASGVSRPLVVIAEHHGWEGRRGRDKARDEIRQCRNRLLLARLGEHTGRAGGFLTSRARQILDEGGKQ